MLNVGEVESAIGRIVLVARGEALCALEFVDPGEAPSAWAAARFPGEPVHAGRDPAGLVSRLRAYLDGDLEAIEGIPATPAGTPFQQEVWRALRRIPTGTTISYGELARAVGRPSASRAVGAANGANPVAVVIPCHRVIRADGSLCGYAGGVERKRWLLSHERAAAPGQRTPDLFSFAATGAKGRAASS